MGFSVAETVPLSTGSGNLMRDISDRMLLIIPQAERKFRVVVRRISLTIPTGMQSRQLLVLSDSLFGLGKPQLLRRTRDHITEVIERPGNRSPYAIHPVLRQLVPHAFLPLRVAPVGVDGAEQRELPGLLVTAVTAAAVTGRQGNLVLVTGVIGRVETPAAQDAGVVRSAGDTPVRRLARPEDVPASLAPRRFGVFCALLGPLGLCQLPPSAGGSFGEKHSEALLAVACEGAEEELQKVLLRLRPVAVVVLGRQAQQALSEFLLTFREHGLGLDLGIRATHAAVDVGRRWFAGGGGVWCGGTL